MAILSLVKNVWYCDQPGSSKWGYANRTWNYVVWGAGLWYVHGDWLRNTDRQAT